MIVAIQVTPDGAEPYTVEITSRDVLMWERTGKDRSLSALFEELRVVDLFWLAHHAARREGMFDGTLTEFEAAHEVMLSDQDQGDDSANAEIVDPTLPAASTDAASSSPSRPASPRTSGPKKASGRSPQQSG